MPGGSGRISEAPGTFADARVLGFIAYVIFPTLAVVTAVFGVVLALKENLAGSLLFFGLLQLWLIGGILVHTRRRRVVAPPGEETAYHGPENRSR